MSTAPLELPEMAPGALDDARRVVLSRMGFLLEGLCGTGGVTPDQITEMIALGWLHSDLAADHVIDRECSWSARSSLSAERASTLAQVAHAECYMWSGPSATGDPDEAHYMNHRAARAKRVLTMLAEAGVVAQ